MSAHQADLFRTARARRDVGINRAGDHADREHAQWRDTAAKLVLVYAEQQGSKPFLIEDAASYAYAHGLPRAREPRAWGSVVQLAKRRGYIVGAGYAAARTSNCSPKCAWRLA